MNSKTIVVLFAITVVVLMMTIDEANAQGARCPRCRGGPADRCLARAARCPPSCRNRRPRPCGIVRNACRCTRGTIRAPNGRCVRPNQCPRTG